MPQQVGKFDFTGIPAAAPVQTAAEPFDFAGVPKSAPVAPPPGMFELIPDALSKVGQSLTTPAQWPMLGGALGGILGGAGGTAFGMGFGGIPGAAGGAALGGGAGEAAKQLVQRATGQPAPGSITDAGLNIAGQGALQGALEVGGGLALKGAKTGAEAVYRGYLKPSLAKVNLKKAKQIVQTALEESLPMTKAGEERAKRLISQINGQVNSILTSARGTVDLHRVADKVRDFATRRYSRPGAPSGDFEAVMKVADDIDNHPSLGLPAGAKTTRLDVPLPEANQTKQALDRAIGETGFGVERSAATEARKVGRRATRQGIEDVAPEVGPLNAREGRLIDTQEAIARGVGREENRNQFFGMPTLLAGGVGAGYGGYQRDPAAGMVMALAARGILSPAMATRIAIKASQLAKLPNTTPAAAVRLALAIEQGLNPEQEPNP